MISVKLPRYTSWVLLCARSSATLMHAAIPWHSSFLKSIPSLLSMRFRSSLELVSSCLHLGQRFLVSIVVLWVSNFILVLGRLLKEGIAILACRSIVYSNVVKF